MESLDFIFKRRSIRKYLNDPVEDVIIEKILRAAMAAPTAKHTEPWRFIVIREEALLEKLREALPFGKFYSPCAICVCGQYNLLKEDLSGGYWVQDCSAASQNILLAATALGLGSVWCGVYPTLSTTNAVRFALDIPDEIIPLNVIYVGYPNEAKPARTQYDPDKIFVERYGRPWNK